MTTTWPPSGVTQRLLALKELQSLVRASRESDPGYQHLVLYLVVRSAGLIESVRDEVASEYCRAVSHHRAHRRVAAKLRHGEGARPSQLIDFVKTFDMSWASELQDFFEDEETDLKARVSSLVSERNKIAHGDGSQVRPSQALQMAEAAIKTAKWLSDRFNPQS